MVPQDDISKFSFFSKPRSASNSKFPIPNYEKSRKTRHVLRIVLYVFVVLIIIVFALYIIGVREQNSVIAVPSEEVVRSLSTTARLYQIGNVDDVRTKLDQNNEQLLQAQELLSNDPRQFIFGITNIAVPLISNAGNLIGTLLKLNGDFLSVLGIIGEISHNGFSYLINDGEKLIFLLETGEEVANQIVERSGTVKNITSGLKNFDSSITKLDTLVGESYLTQSSEAGSIAETFGAARKLFGSSENKHVLLLFEDDKHVLPGGGEIIAYGDAVIREGQLRDLIIRGVEESEDSMKESATPPFPIDSLSSKWELPYALWSSSFESSARSAAYILEHGTRYQEEAISFDAVISISRLAFEEILNSVGLIYKEEDFVQNTLKLRSLLDTLDESRAIKLLEKLGDESMRGNIRFWARDSQLNAFLGKIGVNGGFNNNNQINSDFESYIGITIVRSTEANKNSQYSGTTNFRLDSNGDIGIDVLINSVYLPKNGVENLQFITNTNAELVFIDGNVREGIAEQRSYPQIVYDIAPELETYVSSQSLLSNFMVKRGVIYWKSIFEVTRRSSGSIAPDLSLRFQTPNNTSGPVKAGETFTFVFEIPPGLYCDCDVSASAPVGFIWEESGTATVSVPIDGNTRITRTLTLKIQ